MKENPLSTIYLLLPSWPLGTGNINRSVFIYGGWLGVEGAMVNVAGRLIKNKVIISCHNAVHIQEK